MTFQAKTYFPEIDFEKSVMIGNSSGMKCIFVREEHDYANVAVFKIS